MRIPRWVQLVGLPLLILAFSVARPAALQPPNVPSAFDKDAAALLAQELATLYPIRGAGSTGAGMATATSPRPATITSRISPKTSAA